MSFIEVILHQKPSLAPYFRAGFFSFFEKTSTSFHFAPAHISQKRCITSERLRLGGDETKSPAAGAEILHFFHLLHCAPFLFCQTRSYWNSCMISHPLMSMSTFICFSSQTISMPPPSTPLYLLAPNLISPQRAAAQAGWADCCATELTI